MYKETPSPSLHFLCVGIDPNVISHLLATDKLDISLDICKTMQDARQKIETTSYQVYLIDFSLSGIAFELVQDIKNKEKKNCFIAAILGNHHEEERFIFKDIIDERLQKPVDSKQIDNMLVKIKQHFFPTILQVNDKLQELKRQYASTINEKLDLLDDLIKAAQNHPDSLHLNELKGTVHKIGGSAGSYGFPQVSTLCKELDLQISERLNRQAPIDQHWLSSFDGYLQQIRDCFLPVALKKEESITEISQLPKQSLYVVDHDKSFLELLEHVKDQFALELSVESDPKTAINQLKQPDFNPSALIVSQKFPSSTLKGFDIVETLRQKPNPTPAIYALILEEDNIDIRLEALKRGIDYIFRKPVYANILLKAMKDALESKIQKRFKVLVLDDDTDFCNFVTIVLSEIGFTVRTINESTDLFKTLDEFKPHILLLDLVLAKYDGLNLLRTLRQDVSYNNLIVVIVTSSEEPMTRLSVYSAKADDILYKPLDIDILQNRLLNLAERRISLEDTPEDKDLVSQINLKTLFAQLNKCLTQPVGHVYYLALFEVDHFADWMEQKGHGDINDLLISISKQLEMQIDSTMQSFPYSLSKFAVVFDEQDLHTIEKKIQNILSNIIKNEASRNIAFNCSIVMVSKTYGNAEQILQAGEQCLSEAREKEPAPIRMVVLLPEADAPIKKNVVLIDNDEELLKILTTAFESHGIAVKTFTEGTEALKYLLACKPHRLPSLTIAERKLIDMDGIEILNKLKAHFNIPIPFYILTVFSSDKDVSEGLRQGALEYIGKPFNLSLLMQKALKTIFNK